MNPEQLNAALIAASRLERHREFILDAALRVALSGAIRLEGMPPVDVAAMLVDDYYSLLEATRIGRGLNTTIADDDEVTS